MLKLLFLFFIAHSETVPPYCQDLFKHACDNPGNRDEGMGGMNGTDPDENSRKLAGVMGITFPGYLYKLKQLGKNNKTWAAGFSRQINKVLGNDHCQPDLVCLDSGEVKHMMARFYMRTLNVNRAFYPGQIPFLQQAAGERDSWTTAAFEVDSLGNNAQARNLALRDRPQLIKELKVSASSDTLVNRLVPNARAAATEYVAQNLPPSPQKEEILTKLRTMTFKVGQDTQLGPLIHPNASNSDNKVTYQGSMLIASNSIFMHAYLLAHEIAHSFDPCSAANGSSYTGEGAQEAAYPFRELAQCLRKPSNINALAYPAWVRQHLPNLNPNSIFTPRYAAEEPAFMRGLETFCKNRQPSAEERKNYEEHIPLKLSQQRFNEIKRLCPALKNLRYRELPYRETDDRNRTSDDSADRNAGSPDHYCNTNDQIGESFCDWFAFQILPSIIDKMRAGQPPLTQQQFINGMMNLRWEECGAGKPQKELEYGVHPNSAMRIKVAVVQPEIRKRMGCPAHPQIQHCSLKGLQADTPADGQRNIGQ